MSDPSALVTLAKLISEPAQFLRTLGEQPLAVASASNKFNDAGEDDFWCAVQLGRYRWEQSQFFGSSDGWGGAKEFSTKRLPADGYGSANASAEDIQAARELLKGLDRSGWHDAAKDAIDLPHFGGILALVIQFDQVWLHCSHPQGSSGEQIMALVDGRLETLEETDDRFDELIGHAELIRCKNPSQDIVAKLTPRAKAHFGDEIEDESASRALASTLSAMGSKIDQALRENSHEIPSVAVKMTQKYSLRKYEGYAGRYDHDLPSFVVEDTYFDRNHFNIVSRDHRYADLTAKIELWPCFDIEGILKLFDYDDIRALFEQATGIDTFDSTELITVVANGSVYLQFRHRLYEIGSGGIVLLESASASNDPFGPGSTTWLNRLGAAFATPRTFTMFRR